MTDQTAMSPEEKLGREIIARTAFEKEAVWLPSLAAHHMNGGQTFIDGKTFTECLIEGPAVMAIMNGTTFDGCNMGVAKNPRTLLLDPRGDMIAGAIGMSNCRFVRCRFVQVGFTGAKEALDELEQGLLSARAEAEAQAKG